MASTKGPVSWIVTALLVLVALAVIWSIWNSLQDTREKLRAQKEKMEELERKDAAMRRYVDSLDNALAQIREREQQLAEEREALQQRLARLQQEYQRVKERIDQLWEAKGVIGELDQAFPHWAGQFWEAQRADGVHGIIAPRLFGAEVAEIKADLDKSEREIGIKDSVITNLDSTVALKNEEVKVLEMKADSIMSTYNNLFAEYQELDKKYRKEVASKWFKFTPGNILSFGVGAGAGYLIGKSAGD
ncbi:MAG: hypothetical protein HUU32_10475 [Calditrichaceae bacterium]|nr:hypothetical protein [Calditrichia bacterium]NUQ41808.1 hypothetical protein [Calditrichaceae bacterium]